MLLLSTKLKNEIQKVCADMNLEIKLKNISINGVKKGCSGYILNKDNNVLVYTTTECFGTLGYMYRYERKVDNHNIYGCNRFARNTKDASELAKCIRDYLKNETFYQRDTKSNRN